MKFSDLAFSIRENFSIAIQKKIIENSGFRAFTRISSNDSSRSVLAGFLPSSSGILTEFLLGFSRVLAEASQILAKVNK